MQAITFWSIIIFQRNGQKKETKTGDKEQTKKLKHRQDCKRKKPTGRSLKLPAAGCRGLIFRRILILIAAGFIRMYPHTL